jgi:hypothetical protein
VTEFDIQGDVIIAGSRIIVPVGIATVLPGVAIAISTIQSPIPISGTINVGTVVADIQGGTVTVASVLSPVTVQGTVTTSGGGGGGTVQVAGGTLDVNVISGTVELVGGTIGVQGTVTAIVPGGGTVYGTVSVQGTVTSIPANGGTVVANGGTVGVQGTVTAIVPGGGTVYGTVSVQGTVTSIPANGGTVVANGGTVSVQQTYQRTNVVAGATIVAGTTASTLVAKTLQDLVVDTYYGTVYPAAGSVQAQVMGLEPQSLLPTSTILAGSWVSGTLGAGQRLQVAGPIGEMVVVQVLVVGGTVGPAWVSAEQSATE